MPESLTRKTTLAEATCGWPASARNGGRLQIGMAAGFMSEWVAGFASEPWPASIGMTGRHHSESARVAVATLCDIKRRLMRRLP